MNKSRAIFNPLFKRSDIRAFTLMEAMLVTGLIALIGSAVFQAFNNGLKIWQKSNQITFEEDIVLSLERMRSDFNKMVYYSQIPFEGTSERISFAAIVTTQADRKLGLPRDSYVSQIGRIQYQFLPYKNQLVRRQANYAQALRKKFQSERILLPSVKSFKIQYVYDHQGEFHLKDEALGIIPHTLRVIVTYDEKKQQEMERIFDIPVGG